MARPALHKVRSTIWLPPDIKANLVRIAEKSERSESEIVEDALIAYYKSL